MATAFPQEAHRAVRKGGNQHAQAAAQEPIARIYNLRQIGSGEAADDSAPDDGIVAPVPRGGTHAGSVPRAMMQEAVTDA